MRKGWLGVIVILGLLLAFPLYHASQLSRAALRTYMAARDLSDSGLDDSEVVLNLAEQVQKISRHLSWFADKAEFVLGTADFVGFKKAGEFGDLGICISGLVESGSWALLGMGETDSSLQGAAYEMALHREVLTEARDAAERASVGLDGVWADRAKQLSLVSSALLAVADSGLEDQTWLACFQNKDEIRATGGFISAVALITISDGNLDVSNYSSSQDIEAYYEVHPTPPIPLQTYMGASVLLMRDANWSPDFSSSAAVMASLYEMDTEKSIDGVIAIDMDFLQLVLDAVGGIDVEGYDGVEVTGENFYDLFISYWEQPKDAAALGEAGGFADWLAHHKDFGGDVMDSFVSAAHDMGARELLNVLQAVVQGAEQKHLFAWSENLAVQADIEAAGLAGDIKSSDCDYLMVVDTNMGWNKVDRNIEQAINYAVAETADGLTATLEITYTNLSTPDGNACDHRSYYRDTYAELANDCYWDYVRVYAQPGCELLSITGTDEPVDASISQGKQIWGTFIVVPKGETYTLVLKYLLPAQVAVCIEQGDYSLVLQGQAGRTDIAVSVMTPFGEETDFMLTGDVELVFSGEQAK